MSGQSAIPKIDEHQSSPASGLDRLIQGGVQHFARIEGIVLVEMVVTADGTPSDLQVVRSLDTKFGLDEESLKAARQFKFKPAMKEGKAVAMRVTLEVTFSLK